MEFEGTSDIPRAKNAIHITTDAREPITSVSFIPGSHQTLAAITTRVSSAAAHQWAARAAACERHSSTCHNMYTMTSLRARACSRRVSGQSYDTLRSLQSAVALWSSTQCALCCIADVGAKPVAYSSTLY
eukprot:5882-Heterococcus_DN1.PRE.1